jgi:primary-amine oxidase
VGNYEYGFYWYLYTDGTIEYEIKLTGIIATGAVPEGDQPRWGSLVAPGLYGPHHQHIFNVRLDMSVDGPGNRVYEVDSLPERDPARDPGRNAWVTRSTLLETEDQASRDFDYGTARYWLIANHEVHNELGGEVAYKLIPAMSAPPMFKDGSFIHDRARFAVHDLWVTAYDPDEMFAAGDYPYQSPGIDGLPRYAAQGRRVADADLVVWYNFAAHHVVRPEDWPVMPVTQAGFKLKPVGFFDGNPALDLPPEHESGNGSVCCH